MGKKGHPCCFVPLRTEVGSKASVKFDLMTVGFFFPGCPCSLHLLNPSPSCSPFSSGSYKQAKWELP